MSRSRDMASKWLDENRKSRRRNGRRYKGQKANHASSTFKRRMSAKNMGDTVQGTIKEFVEKQRHSKSNECVFVPGAVKGCPAALSFCDRLISAARYMLLLTQGTPKSEGMVVRHLCGNGHLSCVNPTHLAWGTPGDNTSDAVKHRSIGDDATAQDKLNAVTPNT